VLLGSECRGDLGCVAPDGLTNGDRDAAPSDGDDAAIDGNQPDACAPGAPVPVAHFRFDEGSGLTLWDSAGTGTVGRLVNFDANAWSAGQVGGALSFDGSDDYITIGARPRPVRTLSLWLKPAGTHVTSSETEMVLPSSHGPTDLWGSPEKAYADDDEHAFTAGILGVFKLQHWGGFHLDRQVPPGADILGISVFVDTANLGLLGYFSVQLSWDGGSSHTMANYGWAQLVAGSPLQHAGGPDKTWERPWNSTEFSDSNFLVRASFGGIVNTMYIDYVAVQVHYAPFALGRSILSFDDRTELAFRNQAGGELAMRGANSAVTLVNGVAEGALTPGAWNHVIVLSDYPLPVSDLRLAIPQALPGAAFQGAMDELVMFEELLTPDELAGFLNTPACAP
jgi:hypothetical protein